MKHKAAQKKTTSHVKPQHRLSKNDSASPELEPENVPERMSLRDPEEPSEGPLRFDDTNYSVERLTPSEGDYNVYPDDEQSYLDESDASRPGARDPQFPENSEREILETLPETELDTAETPPMPPQDEAGKRGQSEQSARNDLAILDVINDILSELPESEAGTINVTVEDSTVTLQGNVNNAPTRTRIEQAIESIPGVQAIRNCLTVRGEGEYPRWSDE